MAGRETRATAKQTTNRARADSKTNNSVESNQSTKSKVGSVTSNGGPRAAAALLSLGQDLTTTSGEAAALVSGEPSTVPERVQNPLESVSDIPTMPQIGQKKRKRSKSKDEEENKPNLPDFSHWLPRGEEVGNWDVLCGRGGECNERKSYRVSIFLFSLYCSDAFFSILCSQCSILESFQANPTTTLGTRNIESIFVKEKTTTERLMSSNENKKQILCERLCNTSKIVGGVSSM